MHSAALQRLSALVAAPVCLAAAASAQFNDPWVEFVEDNSMLSSGTISDANNETDLIWGDLDKDGYTDLVIVRKQPFTSTGKRTNILLMNENGVLTNRTSTYATDADVGGDNGFNTATNDRDVQLPDVDGDGWLDVVTATTLSDGDPKHLGHPRIYRNEGETGGNWNGLRFENSRFPQLLHYGTGNPQNPRFCSVAIGDLTGNGFPDLFFGDYDSSGAGGAQQGSNEDMNDRCLINNGSGFYSDESQARCTSSMLLSAFGMATEIHDVNLDGRMDVIKDSALNAPQNVRVLYNNLNGTGGGDGNFNVEEIIHTNAPYHIDVADLNNDGRPDIVVTDDFSDRYRFNTGNDGLGRADWSSSMTFDFISGGDDGFGSNNLIADLDMDGWNDVMIADVDVDIGGYTRRLHIYHNRGTVPGSTNFDIREERQSSGSGWVGVVGMTTGDMDGTHDMAVFDIDNDGDNDMVISRRDGTSVWRSLVDPAPPVVTATTWTGANSSTWTDAGNWSDGVPDSTIDVTIPAGTPNSPSTGGSTRQVDQLTVDLGATVTISGDLEAGGDVVVNGTTTGSGVLRLVGNNVVTDGASSSVGNVEVDTAGAVRLDALVVDGDFDLTAGTVEIDGTVELNGTSTFAGGAVIATNSITADLLRLDGPASWTGTDAGSCPDTDSYSSWTSNASFSPETNEVTFRSGSTQTVSCAGSNFYHVQVNAGTTVDVVSPELVMARDLNVDGGFTGGSTIRFNGTNPTILSDSACPNIVCDVSGTLDIDAGSSIGGALSVESGTFRLDAGITVSGLLTVNGGTLSTNSTANVLQLNGGMNFAGGGIATAPVIHCDGNWTSSAAFQPTSNLVQFEGGGTHDVSCDGSTFRDVTIASGTTIDVTSATLELHGTLTTSGSLTSNDLITFVGASQTIPSGAALPNVDVDSSGTVTVGGNITVSGDLGLTGGTLRLDGDVDVAGNVSLTGGSLTKLGPEDHTLDIAGNLTHSSTNVNAPCDIDVGGTWFSFAGFNPGNGTVRFDGGPGPAQSVTPGNGDFFDVEIAGGTTINVVGNLDLTGSLSATGAFTTGDTVRFVGSGTQAITGGSSLPHTVIDASGTVTLGSNAAIGGTLSVLAGNLQTAGNATVAGAATFSGGTLSRQSGGDVLTLNGAAQFLGTSATNPPHLVVNDGWTSNGSFSPASNEVRFDGGGTKDVSVTGSVFHDVELVGTTLNVTAGPLALTGTLDAAAGFTGSSDVRLVGASPDVTAGSQLADLEVAASGTATVGPADLSGDLTVTSGTLSIAGDVTVGDDAAFNGGSLTTTLSTNLLDVNDAVTFAGTSSTTPPDIQLGGDWVSDSSFAPTQGAVVFTGAPTIFSPSTVFHDVSVTGGTADVTTAGGLLQWAGTLDAATGGFSAGDVCRFVGTAGAVADGSNLRNGESQGSGTLTLGNGVAFSGTFDHTSGALAVAGTTTVTLAATFSGGSVTDAGGELVLDGAANFTGSTAASPPTIRTRGTWTSNASFQPTSGTVIFDGASTSNCDASGSVFRGVTVDGRRVNVTSSSMDVAGTLTTINGGDFGGNDLVKLVGSGQQVGPATLTHVEVDAGGTVTAVATVDISDDLTVTAGTFAADGTVNVTGNAAFEGGSLAGIGLVDIAGNATFSGTTATAAPTIRCDGTWTANGTFAPTSGAVELTGNHDVVATAPDFETNFADVTILSGTRTIAVDQDFDASTITVAAGATLDVNTTRMAIPGTTVTIDGDLRVDAGGELALGGGVDMDVTSTGTLRVVGTSGNPAVVAGDAGGGYDLTIDGTLEASHFTFRDMGPGGVVITASATLGANPEDLRVGSFTHPSSTAGSTMLDITRSSATELRYVDFDDPLAQGTFNVRSSGGSTVTFVNSVGSIAGESFDDDGGGLIDWVDLVTTLSAFEVCPGPELLKVDWTTATEEDATLFTVETAPTAGGPWTSAGVEVPAGAGSSYSVTVSGLAADVEVFARLRETLAHGPVRELDSGSATPWPADLPPWVANVGAGGDFATIQAAIDAASGARSVLLVEAGTYPSFTMDGLSFTGNLHVMSDGSGPITIDTTGGPVLIQNTGFLQVVELSDLEIGSGGSPNAGVSVQNTFGPVILNDLVVTGGAGQPAITANGAFGLAVQRTDTSGSPGVLVDGITNSAVSRGNVDSVELRGFSEMMTCENAPTTTVEAGSVLTQYAGAMLDLDAPKLPSLKQDFTIDITGNPLEFYQLNLSIGYSYFELNDPSFFQMVLLMDLLKYIPVVTGSTDGSGAADLTIALPPNGNLLGLPIVFQGWAVDFVDPHIRFSNVLSLHAMP